MTRAAAPATITAEGLGHDYEDLTAISGLDLSVAAGRTQAIVGPSGCGKSTLLEILSGLTEPSRGTVEVAGEASPAGRLERSAFMPQRDCLLPWYPAIDNAGLALLNQGRSRKEARAAAHELFERFGLAGFEASRPDQLSGGMRQRVAFLRTLLSGKPVLLLDEPFASLDAITRAELQEWLAPSLVDGSHTVVLVTHDVEEALYLADSVVVLSGRPGVEVGRIDAPPARGTSRDEVVTDPEFVLRREEVMSLLRESR